MEPKPVQEEVVFSEAQAKLLREVKECFKSPGYFLNNYGRIYDPQHGMWIPFDLWPAQEDALAVIEKNRQVVVLKARQLGLSWLCLGFALWQMLFRPAASVLIFSKRDDEAKYLLGQDRLRGMWLRLPDWLKGGVTPVTSGAHEWTLSNGSSARAFPTTGGRSYTASLAIVDEADFAEDLDGLLNAVKPTVDAGGKLILLSTSDKSRPLSPYKRIYRAAVAGENSYAGIFLPWFARPDRDDKWYAEQRADCIARTGALDDLEQEYPASDVEALAGRTLDKRFPAAWIADCYVKAALLESKKIGIPGVRLWAEYSNSHAYVIGADPAEGNPQSDESSACVLDVDTGEQVALLSGRYDPAIFAGYVKELSEYYGNCPAMVERNNHGHAVLLWLSSFSNVLCYTGLDGKTGWLTTGRSKPLAVDNTAEFLREKKVLLHDEPTRSQLAQLDGATLAAPEGEHDDRAMALMLALAGLRWRGAMPTNLAGSDPFGSVAQQHRRDVTLVATPNGKVKWGYDRQAQRKATDRLRFGRSR